MTSIIQVIESAMAARDPYTVIHQQRVAQIACAIAWEMGLVKGRVMGLWMAATIHDLGKIAIPAEILTKPARLTSIEFALIKTHPEVGHSILKPIKFPNSVATIILQHHERINGSGYPFGLKGSEILLEAKILAVADVFEAMSSHRPYRPALGLKKACEEIREQSGKLYDRRVVAACLQIYGDLLKDDRLLAGSEGPRASLKELVEDCGKTFNFTANSDYDYYRPAFPDSYGTA